MLLDGTRTFSPDNYHARTGLTVVNIKMLKFQGLNYVAGMLLLVTNDEEDTFWLLKILTEELLPNYYAPDIPGLLADVKVLEELIR